MNIALRPSGGRGEYELAGRQGALHVHDLFGLTMFIEILPGVEINAYSNCVQRDGKPRIRLTQPARNAHPATLIAAALMLPKPRRERHETHGASLRWEQFVIQTIRIDVVPRSANVLVCPVIVRLENADGLRLDISFAERMARVVRVWAAADKLPAALAEAVRTHAKSFTSPATTQEQLTSAYYGLHKAMNEPDDDMLLLLEKQLGLVSLAPMPVEEMLVSTVDEALAEEVQTDPSEARIERVRQWRLAAVRGGSASAFRREVQQAYDYRCVFSGQRLPRTGATSTAGVDAAHILPWSRFNLDSAVNGLCLNKQCHWAFDEGLLRLSFDPAESSYVVSIPNPVRLAAEGAKFDIQAFDSIVGKVPRKRLPSNESLWPSAKYLNELNTFMDNDAA